MERPLPALTLNIESYNSAVSCRGEEEIQAIIAAQYKINEFF
jgi:hypothetical protein